MRILGCFGLLLILQLIETGAYGHPDTFWGSHNTECHQTWLLKVLREDREYLKFSKVLGFGIFEAGSNLKSL